MADDKCFCCRLAPSHGNDTEVSDAYQRRLWLKKNARPRVDGVYFYLQRIFNRIFLNLYIKNVLVQLISHLLNPNIHTRRSEIVSELHFVPPNIKRLFHLTHDYYIESSQWLFFKSWEHSSRTIKSQLAGSPVAPPRVGRHKPSPTH